MRSYSLHNCLKVYRNQRIVDQCFESKSPSIGTIKRAKGQDFTEAFLAAWLVNLNEILNLKKPMTEAQIILCIIEIMKDFYYLKVADLTLLFRQIIAGEHGEFYESLSIPKVLTFFRNYDKIRTERAIYLNDAKHDNYKSQDPFEISKNIKRIWRGTPNK